MKTLSLFTCVFFLFFQIGYGNGIGIVDGSNGIYLQVQETRTSVRVTDQIAIITSTQVFKNTSGSINPIQVRLSAQRNFQSH